MKLSALRSGSPDRVALPARAGGDVVASTVGASAAFREAMELARGVAASPLTTVLIAGETGSGKELMARTIHSEGANRDQPFVAINCAAIPETLMESELFGYAQGAFTDARSDKRGLFECAGTGTVFLDEIGELSAHLQPKLLRVLEDRRFRRLGDDRERPVQCRVVAGTNRLLEHAVHTGEFREDLFYRLNVFRIDVPPLRARGDDVVTLAGHFLREFAERRGTTPRQLDESAIAALRRHNWPGNIRELKNVMERANIVAHGGTVRATDLRIQRRNLVPATTGSVGAINVPPSGLSLVEIEREAIRLTLCITEGNLSRAARILGISRPRLVRRMQVSGLTRRSVLASM
jgi:transcriptional regulator with PAS, ATPase and Fis domain